MPVYRYRALTADEQLTTGVVEASNPKDARMRLLGDNLFLLDLNTASAGARRSVSSNLLSRKKASELALVTRQFATLSKAGIPLADALAALVDVIENPKLQITFRDLRENVTQGMSLEEALKATPDTAGAEVSDLEKELDGL